MKEFTLKKKILLNNMRYILVTYLTSRCRLLTKKDNFAQNPPSTFVGRECSKETLTQR